MYSIQNPSYKDIVTISNCSLIYKTEKKGDLQKTGTQQTRNAVSKEKLVYDHTEFNRVIELLIVALDKLGARMK